MLVRLTVEDAERTDSILSLLMGTEVSPRKKLIESEGYRYFDDSVNY